MGDVLDCWLPAALLVVVALTQVVLTHTAGLSPWKGGGFGMFAVIDSPGKRVLSAYGVTIDGRRIAIDAWSALDPRARRQLQGLPREEALEQLAERLLHHDLVALGTRFSHAYDRLRRDNPGVDLGQLPEPAEAGRLYRVREPEDPTVESAQVVRLRSVRLQVWRLRFAADSFRLRCEALGAAVESER